jgi:hypothetical protein
MSSTFTEAIPDAPDTAAAVEQAPPPFGWGWVWRSLRLRRAAARLRALCGALEGLCAFDGGGVGRVGAVKLRPGYSDRYCAVAAEWQPCYSVRCTAKSFL